MKIGTDLEYAVIDNNTGRIVPAGVIGTWGAKGNPEPLTLGGHEIDCCALETTPNAANSEDEFVANITHVIEEVRSRYAGYKFITKASHIFTKEELLTRPESMTMGCQPDYNAWTERQNRRPKPKVKGLRSYGGHVHVEGGELHTVKAMDLLLGTWSVLVDDDTDRRSLYGKAGAFRPKPYGIEYRVLSNFWCGDESSIRHVYKLTNKARDMSEQRVKELVKSHGGAQFIQAVINTSNKVEAEAIYASMLKAA